MKQAIARQLQNEAERIATEFSNPDRELNTGGESFALEKVTPMSEYTAVATYLKDSGKFAIYYLFYVKNKWIGFFPTDSHLHGMAEMLHAKQKIEVANYSFNFKDWFKLLLGGKK